MAKSLSVLPYFNADQTDLILLEISFSSSLFQRSYNIPISLQELLSVLPYFNQKAERNTTEI